MKTGLLLIFFLWLTTIDGQAFNDTNERDRTLMSLPHMNKSTKEPASLEAPEEVAFLKHQELVNSYKKDGWDLIWNDEFQTNELNEQKWSTENWASEKNQELHYYRPENVEVKDDHLQLISKKENYQGRKYTSGAVHTRDTFTFQYGRAEIRAKLPQGQGIFPAFWMMPDIENVWLPEIDILEMLGHEPQKIWMVQHWIDKNGKINTDSSHVTLENSTGDRHHTYAVEWSPEKIAWFIDGEKRFESDAYSPDMPMYLYLNTAVGGEWPGSPYASTVFPQTFEIDYVRVLQRIGDDR
ncbi:glycoside hydrolase family 16 protein [Saliterribacillus persicus]|uniref:Glycosyl hydrolase family 16 n=1 Tax=Saliterribacillus persicus TaxID=930114 RepID=A0A368YDC1_9BACI|nr:glycoside hydrolase family 16 protein [Saliterribacillus persicus]RCW77336.1 glycosyl hydrolase family 16 [Saliterribacillus persicus]